MKNLSSGDRGQKKKTYLIRNHPLPDLYSNDICKIICELEFKSEFSFLITSKTTLVIYGVYL